LSLNLSGPTEISSASREYDRQRFLRNQWKVIGSGPVGTA
jgi:hypothetical protein